MIKTIAIEPLKKAASYISSPALEQSLVAKALDEACAVVEKNLPIFTEAYPRPASRNNIYEAMDNTEWTNGFWTGILWLAYEHTGENAFRRAAEKQVQSYLHRIKEGIEVDHHDMGFLYTLSCTAAHKLTASPDAKEAALLAAQRLLGRWQEKGEFIQAWGVLGAADNYRLIIDCLLNLPLLYWASEITGEREFAEKAHKHFITACNHVIRDDASAFHTFYFDPQTGKPLRGVTRQGFNDESSWARGQAWGVYGIPLNYLYTKDEASFNLYRGMTHYFLNRCPEDEVAYWDLIFDDGSGQPRDSSASAIAVCGMLEMDKHLPDGDPHRAHYLGACSRIMGSLIENYSTPRNNPQSNGLLLHGVYSWHSGKGVDECNLWGDYYYLEALMRLWTGNKWKPYW